MGFLSEIANPIENFLLSISYRLSQKSDPFIPAQDRWELYTHLREIPREPDDHIPFPIKKYELYLRDLTGREADRLLFMTESEAKIKKAEEQVQEELSGDIAIQFWKDWIKSPNFDFLIGIEDTVLEE